MATTIMTHVASEEGVRCVIDEVLTGSYSLRLMSEDRASGALRLLGSGMAEVTMFFKNEESLRQAMYAIRQAIDNYECQLDGLDYMDYEREPF